MALKYNAEYRNTAIIGDKEIKFKPWTTKNEKDYLISMDEDNPSEQQLYDVLIKPCLKDPNIVLSTNEQKKLMIEIRKASIGPTFPMKFSCSSCNNVNDIDVSFDKIVKFKPDNFEPIEIENMKFVFSAVSTEALNKKIQEQKIPVERSFVEFLAHIKEIEIDGELENTFSFNELKEFVESLPSYMFDEVYKKFNVMKSTLDFEFKTYCIICGKENTINFEYLPNFLWA